MAGDGRRANPEPATRPILFVSTGDRAALIIEAAVAGATTE
jgi:hypothetical protein